MAKRTHYFELILAIAMLGAVSCGMPAAAAEKSAVTSDSHYGEKEEGWFWYKDPKEEKAVPPPPQKPVPPPPPPPQAKVDPTPEKFSLEWLKKEYPRLRNKAIEDPTDDNVRVFLYTQRIIMDKAQNFANASKKIGELDPFLDEGNRVPFATAAKAVVMRYAAKAREEALQHLSKKTGIWFFFDGKCAFCKAQATYLRDFQKETGFIVKNISLDGSSLPGMGDDFVRDQGQAELLGLQIVPTTVLVVPPNGFYIVSQGLNSTEGLGDKILLAAESNNLVPKALMAARNPGNRGVLSPDDMKNPPLSDDPKEMVRFLQKKLGTRYATTE